MNLRTLRTSSCFRFVCLLSVIALAGALFSTSLATSQAADDAVAAEAVQTKFQQVVALRLKGEYDRAVEMLREIIAEYSNSDEVLRIAYNHLVTVYVQNDDEPSGRVAARTALERFSDLTADPFTFPGKVNDVYDQLRKEMFGSLVVSEPQDCHVYLDSTHVGDTPLRLELYPIGEYDLTVTKSGYKDYVTRIEIQPESTRELSVSLDRDRAWWYWPAWIGGATVAVVALVIGLSPKDEAPPDQPQPLPEPPEPPTN